MSFGPLPAVDARPITRPRVHRRRVTKSAGRRDVMALASLLLGYPDDAMTDLQDQLADAVGGLPDSAAASDLREFMEWFVNTDAAQRRVDYVKTFDHRRRSALYVTFAPYGDSRSRGDALASLRKLYNDAGFFENGDELPDYLPTVLQFAAQVSEAEADAVLGQSRAGIESIHEALRAHRSPYASVMRAVIRCLPAEVPSSPQQVAPDLEGVLA
ncbi:MAG: nitrate reductase molybdenum cofactor assembly chaperone [Propionibacteriaceae bacterium]|nr:nitrate reductase molybdenum cofactor assembly chaperone [Propionibacteriaceae bacterium]